MTDYLARHAQVFLASLGQLARAPGSTLLTVCVIGITLSLPAILHLLVDNARSITGTWQGTPQISIFLSPGTPDEAVQALRRELAGRPGVESVELIDAARALEEFKARSGFGEALDVIPGNPLPDSLVVRVHDAAGGPGAIEAMVREIQGRPGVDMAQWDLAWVERLHVILKLVQRAILLLAVLLGLAVIIIVSNTIRLAVTNRREEIETMKLIGATDGFIRRPFLYWGLIQGILGAACAVLIVIVCLHLVSGPVARLISLYGGGFALRGIDGRTIAVILLAGGFLGWIAARAAVGRHLRAIEPR